MNKKLTLESMINKKLRTKQLVYSLTSEYLKIAAGNKKARNNPGCECCILKEYERGI